MGPRPDGHGSAMPSTDIASTSRARTRHDRRDPARPGRPANRPARWEPPTRVDAEAPARPEPQPDLVQRQARHFGTRSIPAQHHWVLDTFMVIAGIVVLLLLFA